MLVCACESMHDALCINGKNVACMTSEAFPFMLLHQAQVSQSHVQASRSHNHTFRLPLPTSFIHKCWCVRVKVCMMHYVSMV